MPTAKRPASRVHLASTRTLVLLLGTLAVARGARAQEMISLERAYALALRNNPSIQLLQERVRQAEAARAKAWAAIKPTAFFQGAFTHYDEEIVIDFSKSSPIPIPGLEPIVFQKQDQFSFSAGATLPLFRGPAYPGIVAARRGVDAARHGAVRSRQDFLVQVARAYYLVVSQKEVVRALENKVDVDAKHLAAAQAQFQVGQAPRSVVLRAELVATQDSQTLRAERNTLGASQRQLAILLGHPSSVDVTRPAEPAEVSGADRALVAQAVQARQDIQASRLSIDIAEKVKDTTWWGFLPSLDLSYLYRWTESSGFAGKRGAWYLMLTMNVPIYDGGVRYATLRDSQSKVRQAVEQERALVQQIEAEIVKLRADVDSATAGAVSARKAVDLARTTASDMEVSFEAGAVTQLDVLDASQRLLDAELALTRVLFARDLARLQLAHAVGRFDAGARAP